MPYDYTIERPWLFTEEGVEAFISLRDYVITILKRAGVVRMDKTFNAPNRNQPYDSWRKIALVDRMVELGELREIPQENCAGQHRVFVATDRLPT